MLSHKTRFMKRIWVFVIAFVLMFPAVVSAASEETTNEVRTLLSTMHVSGVTADQLQGKSISEMLNMLDDPYTVYMTQADYKEFLDSIENSFIGIGVRIGQDEAGIYIAEVFKGTPADKSGVNRGDYITAIDGTSAAGLTTTDAVNRILGKEGTNVTLTVSRGGKTLPIEIVRGLVQIPVVESNTFASGNGSVGYIKLTTFSTNAGELFAQAFKQMRSDNPDLQSLVIDLRNNGGGYLNSAQTIAAQFIKEGVFLHLKDRTGTDHPLTITSGATFDKPVYIMMNEYSASASEVLAGALRDSANAKLIGTKSFGKGSVQYLVPLAGDEALKVTVQEYFTPKFGKVNKVGLKPDQTIYTDTAQLVAALHTAGIGTVAVETNGHNVTVNGVDVGESLVIKQEGGQTYVPSRLLAELIGAGIAWNTDEWAVDVKTAGVEHSFPIADGIALMSGNTAYINVDAFAETFPSLVWASNGNLLSLKSALSAQEK